MRGHDECRFNCGATECSAPERPQEERVWLNDLLYCGMTYEEKLYRLLHIVFAEFLGMLGFFFIWFLFCAIPDYWYEFSSDQYLMLWGYAGGVLSLLTRRYIIKLAI